MSDLDLIKNSLMRKYAAEEILIDEDEYNSLPAKEKQKYALIDEEEGIYRKPIHISPEEIDKFITLMTFEAQMDTKANVIEIKNAILMIKNIIVAILAISIVVSILFLILQATM